MTCEKFFQTFSEMLTLAYLTFLQWPFKVFFSDLDHRGPFYEVFWLWCNAGNMVNWIPLHKFLFKKILFWCNVTHMIKGSAEVMRYQKNWHWKVTVSRSNELGPRCEKKSDVFICRSLLCIWPRLWSSHVRPVWYMPQKITQIKEVWPGKH